MIYGGFVPSLQRRNSKIIKIFVGEGFIPPGNAVAVAMSPGTHICVPLQTYHDRVVGAAYMPPGELSGSHRVPGAVKTAPYSATKRGYLLFWQIPS